MPCRFLVLTFLGLETIRLWDLAVTRIAGVPSDRMSWDSSTFTLHGILWVWIWATGTGTLFYFFVPAVSDSFSVCLCHSLCVFKNVHACVCMCSPEVDDGRLLQSLYTSSVL